MPITSKTTRNPDEISELASRGKDVSAYFTNKFTVVRPVFRVKVGLTQGILREVDERAARLNVSRQAVIKLLLERALIEERSINSYASTAVTASLYLTGLRSGKPFPVLASSHEGEVCAGSS